MKYIYLSFLFLFPVLKSQNYIVADPYYLINYELKQFNNIEPFHSTSFRPFYLPKDKSLSISFINEIYINNNASNQENMDLRYLGKGIGSFRSLAISGYSKYFAFSIEPYQLNHNYIGTKTYFRPISYKFLNDSSHACANLKKSFIVKSILKFL